MATAVHIPVSEYLRTSYEPDCDYVDGEIEERNSGEQWHAAVQNTIGAIFFMNRKSWNLRALAEQRVQVSPTRFRVPDVCAVPSDKPFTGILTEPPVLCVEVLSPEDRFQRVITRAQEYLRMGVINVWLIDPKTRECWVMGKDGGSVPMMDEAFTIPGTAVRLAIADIFEEIDSAPKA
jgi:Uma2 family endonuclease